MLDLLNKENVWEGLLSKSYDYLFSMDVATIIDEVTVRAEILYGDKYQPLLNEKAMSEVIGLLRLEEPLFPIVNDIMTESFIGLIDYEEEALAISMIVERNGQAYSSRQL